MEYLHGQPLTRVLNRMLRGPSQLSLPLRLRILTSVLAGLEHAHTLTDLDGTPMGVVHRDVSPQNVFVTYDGQVKLVDFGVAKTLAASHHTRPGAIKGKLAYMAPEQLQRNTIDRRADVFAVGVMLWEMLAGRRMWHGMTEVEIVAHLASNQPLPPLPSDGSVPAGLEAICTRALDLDPDRRYQTAAELELELEGMLAGTADSHARNLGKVVSLAFDVELSDRQAFIERCVAPARRPRPSARSSTQDDAGERAARHRRDAVGPGPQAVSAPPRGDPAAARASGCGGPRRSPRWRAWRGDRAGRRRAGSRQVSVGRGARHATAAPPSRDTPELGLLAGRARRSPAGAPRAEPPRARRRHRAPVLDEDATLPPSATDADQRHDREIAAPDDDPRH